MRRFLTTTAASLLLSASLMAAPALAHSDHEHGPNGGVLVEADPYHLELKVGKDGSLVLWVMDHDNKLLPVAGTSVSATVLVHKKPVQVALTAAADGTFTGKADSKLEHDTIVVIAYKSADGKTVQGRFEVE